MAIACAICNSQHEFLGNHVQEAHNMSLMDYQSAHPGAPVVSLALYEKFKEERSAKRRTGAPALEDLKVEFAKLNLPVNTDVPADVCLPLPPSYRLPSNGKLGNDVQDAAIAMAMNRSTYIWGLPGSGKDAFVHAFSALTRTPAEIFSVRPGEDIQAWFFSRSFDQNGTTWEEGRLLQIARDGYTTPDGRKVPYLILISDVDRADKAQAESLRLILDSISGRIKGPGGVTFPVLPGTIFAFTANSAGAGDTRGRCLSSNPIDASLLDRVERKFEFHWMDWADEGPILQEKFPLLFEKAPGIYGAMEKVTEAIRQAIAMEELYCEFSHRALCSWLGFAQDIITTTGKVHSNLLKRSARAWLDGLPDEETRLGAQRIIDPHIKGGAV